MVLAEGLRYLEESVERGLAGDLLAELLTIFDQGSPWLGAVVRRAGSRQWIEAAERRLELTRFVDSVMEQPKARWCGELEGAAEHHGSLLVIVLVKRALERICERPLEALELVRGARASAGPWGAEGLDAEIRLLLDALEAVARQLGGEDSQDAMDAVERGLGEIRASIHPELVADGWRLVAVARRLAAKPERAEEALDQALAWAEGISDQARCAEIFLERGRVRERAGCAGEARDADAAASSGLGNDRGESCG